MVRTRSIRVSPISGSSVEAKDDRASVSKTRGKRRSVSVAAASTSSSSRRAHRNDHSTRSDAGASGTLADLAPGEEGGTTTAKRPRVEVTAADLVHVDPSDPPMEPTSSGEHQRVVVGLLGSSSSAIATVSADQFFPSLTRDSGVQTISNITESKPKILVLPEDLKLKLECPVCSRISLPPIRQCRNGHVTCYSCRLKVQSCPVCREVDLDIRNLFAEKAITYMVIPCEFEQFGCPAEIAFRDKEDHEKLCKFRPYICPYIECDHKLAVDTVVDHVSIAHKEECRRSDGPEITASMILIGQYFGGDGAWSPRLITCFGKTFFDVALTRDRWLHHWVWLLGEEDEAQQYLYEITAFKGNLRYMYGGEVSSLRTSDDEIVSDGQCLSISDAIGKKLRDGDKIRYKLKLIRKTDLQR